VPLADTGLPGMLVFACMVAFCEGVSVLPMKYIEFLVGLCYNLKEYVFVVVIGKTMGALFTYKCANFFMDRTELEEMVFS